MGKAEGEAFAVFVNFVREGEIRSAVGRKVFFELGGRLGAGWPPNPCGNKLRGGPKTRKSTVRVAIGRRRSRWDVIKVFELMEGGWLKVGGRVKARG